MANILAENLQRNLHQVKLVLNKHLGIRRGGNINTIVICEEPYRFSLNCSQVIYCLNTIIFQCHGSKKYYNDALKYDLSEQDREYAIDAFTDILRWAEVSPGVTMSQYQKTLNNHFVKTPFYSWLLPSIKEYESKRLNITDLLIEQVVPEIMELHKIFAKEVAEKDRQVEELMNEFHLFYKWSKEDPVPKFEPKIQNMIASHKLYPSIKHVKEVWK